MKVDSLSCKADVFKLQARLVALLCLVTWIALSGCATRTYHEHPPLMPLVVEPVNAAVLVNNVPVRFIWRAADNAEHYDFHIYDRTTGDIQRYYRSGLNPASVCVQGVCTLTLTINMPTDKGHAWRVRAANYAGNSQWSRSVFQIE